MKKFRMFSLLAGLHFILFSQFAAGAFAAVGDVSDDGAVDIADVIMSLQVGSGLNAAGQFISLGADINGDGKIGLEEAVYGLQVVSGSRIILGVTTLAAIGIDGRACSECRLFRW